MANGLTSNNHAQVQRMLKGCPDLVDNKPAVEENKAEENIVEDVPEKKTKKKKKK